MNSGCSVGAPMTNEFWTYRKSQIVLTSSISSNGCNSRLLLISKQWDKYIMWSDTSLLPKLDDVLETWKPMDAITLTNALISIHYWDDNWSFESALLRFIVCFIIYRPHKWGKNVWVHVIFQRHLFFPDPLQNILFC